MTASTPPLKTSSMDSISRKRYGPSKFQLAMDEARDQAELTTRCLHCDWTITAPAGEARLVAAEHRTREHGWKPKRRKR